MGDATFVGIGFGAIQGGLFLYEAFRSGRFGRLVVAEVVQPAVDALRGAGGRYWVNVATRTGIERHEIGGVEILNPLVDGDREVLIDAVADATELATALPSVAFYGTGQDRDVVDLLSEGLWKKRPGARAGRAVIYTAENHNHAAELLRSAVRRASDREGTAQRYQCLNTVVGKMSGVVTDARQIREQDLAPLVPGSTRAFLVEEFNRILVTRIKWPDFRRDITVFEEKEDLLPFEEAKLYGHNATHALLGYLLAACGRRMMHEADELPTLVAFARDAFLEESGKALCRRHAGVDGLFTSGGYRAYVDDLMERMLNPHLRDAVERVTRDPRRKLGWEDRLVGTMRAVMAEQIEPRRYAVGAAAALRMLGAEAPAEGDALLDEIWGEAKDDPAAADVKTHVREAWPSLAALVGDEKSPRQTAK